MVAILQLLAEWRLQVCTVWTLLALLLVLLLLVLLLLLLLLVLLFKHALLDLLVLRLLLQWPQ